VVNVRSPGGRLPRVVALTGRSAAAPIVALCVLVVIAEAASYRGRTSREPVYSVSQVLVGRAHGPAAWAGRTVLVRGRLVGICDYSYAAGASPPAFCPRMLAPDRQEGTQVTVHPSSYSPHMAYVSVLGAVLSLDGGPIPAPNPLIAALVQIPALDNRLPWSDDRFVQPGIYRVKISDNRGSHCVRAAVCFDAQLLSRQ